MGWLELKVPPPVVALILGLLMWLASPLVAPVEIPSGFRSGVAGVLATAGAVVDLVALITFLRARTTINPIRPGATSALVTGGVFRFSRNPMYLGLLLFLLAWAVYLSSWLALLFVPSGQIVLFQMVPRKSGS